MNKPRLESILKKARLPEIPEESLAMFPRRIVAGIKRNDPPASTGRNFSPHLAWALGLAACVVIAFAIGHWRGRVESGAIPANDSLASAKLIGETLAMFPNRVRAIVEDEHGVNLVLSDNDDVPVSAAALCPHLRRQTLHVTRDLQRPGNPDCRAKTDRAGRRARRDHPDRQPVSLVKHRTKCCAKPFENIGQKSKFRFHVIP